jgi:hypothetical protein
MATYLRAIRTALMRAPFQSICDGSAISTLPQPMPEESNAAR